MIKYLRYATIAIFLGLMGYAGVQVYLQYQLIDNEIAKFFKNKQNRIIVDRMVIPEKEKAPEQKIQDMPPVQFEFAGVFKLTLSEQNSWETIFKIMSLLLGSFFGIKLINAMFSRFEKVYYETK